MNAREHQYNMNHLPYLDIMIQYACNLSCDGCISFSNYNRKGFVKHSDGEQWLKEWSSKITSDVICLFGGEPLLNPGILQWMELVRKYFPDSHLKIITNIYYLKPEHIQKLIQLGNGTLQGSYHYRFNDEYEYLKSHMSQCITGYDWKPTKNDEISFLTLQHTDCFVKNVIFGEFSIPAKNQGKDMIPWNSSNPDKSISLCGNPRNPILYENRLYKCSPIANLKDTLDVLNIENTEWDEYLKYNGYASSDNLNEFIDDIGKGNSICSMCSDDPDTIQKIDHYASNSVKVKKKC